MGGWGIFRFDGTFQCQAFNPDELTSGLGSVEVDSDEFDAWEYWEYGPKGTLKVVGITDAKGHKSPLYHPHEKMIGDVPQHVERLPEVKLMATTIIVVIVDSGYEGQVPDYCKRFQNFLTHDISTAFLR